jgi:hypothetical protein
MVEPVVIEGEWRVVGEEPAAPAVATWSFWRDDVPELLGLAAGILSVALIFDLWPH